MDKKILIVVGKFLFKVLIKDKYVDLKYCKYKSKLKLIFLYYIDFKIKNLNVKFILSWKESIVVLI